MHPQSSSVPRKVVVRLALAKLQSEDPGGEPSRLFVDGVFEARQQFGAAADGLEHDVEYLAELLRGRSDEGLKGIIDGYVGDA